MKIYTICLIMICFLASGQSLANDLYPTNCQPATGSTYNINNSIPVSFNVCFGYDYPVNPGECTISVTIKNQANSPVYSETIFNLTGNGPGVCQLIIAPNFTTSTANTYTLEVNVNYIYDINPGNNTCTTTFEVRLPAPPAVTNISPQNGATNVPPSPAPALSWENGQTTLTGQNLEVKQGNQVIITQSLSPETETFSFPNALLASTVYSWTLVQSNSGGSTTNGPFTFSTAEPQATNLALTAVISPNDALDNYFLGSPITFRLKTKNQGTVEPDDWYVDINVLNASNTSEVAFNTIIDGQAISPGQEIELVASETWTPTDSGLFSLNISVVYEDDTSPNDNQGTALIRISSTPDLANILFPLPGAIDIPINPTLTWENGTTPVDNTKIIVEQLSPPGGIIINEDITGEQQQFPLNGLFFSTQYQWSLEQSNQAGTTINGPFTFFTSEGGGSSFDFQFEVNKLDYLYYSPPSPVGLFTVKYTPGDQGVFLHINAENPVDSLTNTIITNIYLPPVSEADTVTEFSTTFDFGKVSLSYELPLNLSLYAYTTETPVTEISLTDSSIGVATVAVTEITYGPKGSEIPEEQQVTTTTVATVTHTAGDTHTENVYRGDVGNLDLNSTLHPATSTFAGDLNSCVPTATANSMKWMENNYESVNLPEDMTLRKTMETLSGLMKRESEKGTPTENMISGKLDFMEQFNLPVEVKFQARYIDDDIESTSGDSEARNFNEGVLSTKPPTWDFLKEMIEDGEDVEMNYFWHDASDDKYYAHSFNLTGIQEFQSGVKKISFKHDLYQESSGGLKQEVHEISIDDDGWMRFGEHNENFIRDAVVESPTATLGERAAGFINELLTFGGSLKKNSVSSSSASSADEFIEILAKQSIPDPRKYRVTVYNASGEQVTKITLDQFTAGASMDSFIVYSYGFAGDVLPNAYGAVGLSFSGSPMDNYFISWGGTVTAVNGDWTSLTSTDIGITPAAGVSFALSGNGTIYDDFTWASNSNPTPGNFNDSQIITGIEDEGETTLPTEFYLAQNYPNPFNPYTTIEYLLPKAGLVKLTVYNLLGQTIAVLVDETKEAGSHNVEFNAENLNSGVYFYRLEAGGHQITRKLVLMK